MTSLLLLAQLTVLTPGHTGSFEYVPDPTPAKVRALAESGKKPLVVTAEIGHERPALTNWAECASAVAFEVLPRQHLIYSWKALGVTVLKTVRYEREGSPDRFRRDAGIGAFLGGADGIWIPNAKEMPAEWKTALRQAAEDRAVCDRLTELRAKIESRPRRDLVTGRAAARGVQNFALVCPLVERDGDGFGRALCRFARVRTCRCRLSRRDVRRLVHHRFLRCRRRFAAAG